LLLHGPRGGRRPADCWTLSIDLGARAVTLQLIAGLESHAPIRPMPTSSLRARFHERRGGGPGRPLNKERLPAPGVRAAGAIRCPCTLSHAPKRADTPFRHAVARLPLLPRWDRRRRRGGVLAPPVTTAQLCPTCHSRTAPRPRSAPRRCTLALHAVCQWRSSPPSYSGGSSRARISLAWFNAAA